LAGYSCLYPGILTPSIIVTRVSYCFFYCATQRLGGVIVGGTGHPRDAMRGCGMELEMVMETHDCRWHVGESGKTGEKPGKNYGVFRKGRRRRQGCGLCGVWLWFSV